MRSLAIAFLSIVETSTLQGCGRCESAKSLGPISAVVVSNRQTTSALRAGGPWAAVLPIVVSFAVVALFASAAFAQPRPPQPGGQGFNPPNAAQPNAAQPNATPPNGAQPGGGQPAASRPPATPGPAAASGGAVQPFPALPDAFHRGNDSPPQLGGYFSIWKLGWIVVGLFGWQALGNWVNDDATGLKIRPIFWTTTVLLGGLAGLAAILTLDSFALGNLALLLGLGVPGGLYVRERNERVPENSRVLTPDHLQKVGTRWLSKLGITLGGRETVEEVAGPPIEFRGRDGQGGRRSKNNRGLNAAKELVYDAVLRRATDIHLMPSEDQYDVRLRIDGVMYPTDPFDRALGDNVLNIFKVLAAIDITEKRRSQDGSFGADMEGRSIEFRAATQGGLSHGESMTLRVLDQEGNVSRLDSLGLRPKLQDRIRQIVQEPHGMMLTCGPTGAGKSTTLYAALRAIDTDVRNVITIEDPVEYRMKGIKQIEINTKADQTFAGSLRAVLRQDPDVVMVGEIRDRETAVTACQAATTGHMVLSTVHANDTTTALFRLIDLEVEPFMVASSVSAILGQRLARRLCEECRVPYKPSAETLKKLGLPASRVKYFYRPPDKDLNDCPVCGGLGYQGRIGVYELLEIDETMQELIREKASMSQIRGEARKNGMLYMREEGLRLVAKGVTSLEELQRVVK